MAKLNKTDFQIIFRRGLRANLLAAATYLAQGEPVYTIDTKQLFIGDSSARAVPLQSMDMVVIDRATVLPCVDRNNGTFIYEY